MADVHWLTAVAQLRRAREPGVLVTVIAVRGHAPREAGAKMVVGAARTWGTIGGGNLEQAAVVHARGADRGADDRAGDERHRASPTRRPAQHGVQCCGGEVTVLLEPLRPVPAVAIFGIGHVGIELARILARHDLELHLVDSRRGPARPSGCRASSDAVARVHVHHAVVPELVLGELPAGSHVLIMTHDHAEDAALCDAALRCGHLGSIGLIGSAAKWGRFARKLAAEGHDEAALARITTPIGLPEITGKEPATIAVSVAADLLRRLEREAAARPPGRAAADVSGAAMTRAAAREAAP